MTHATLCRVKSRRETNQKIPVRQSEKRANMCELRAPSFYKTTPPLSIYIYAGGFIGGWGWAGSGGRTRLLRYVRGGACAATGCFMRAASGICLMV